MQLPAALIALVLSVLLVAGPAQARYRIGISEQDRAMFSSPAWQRLGLVRTRYLVAWDWAKTGQQAEVDAYMRAARAAGQDVLVTFTAHRGCFNGRRTAASATAAPRARAPTAPRSAGSTTATRGCARTPGGTRSTTSPNRRSRRPRLAVRYYRVLRSERRRRDFRVLAADVLDTANLLRYLRAFRRLAPGRPRLWGLHNYQDVNRGTAGDTRRMLRAVRGEVWLTETNGIVKFGDSRQFRYSEARAARRTRWMFRIADRYDARRPQRRARISRLFVYEWFGAPPGARFDAGVVGPDGSSASRLRVLRRHVPATADRYRPRRPQRTEERSQVKEEELVSRVTDLLREAGAEEPVVAAGIFNPRGHTGGMFAGGLAGDSVGGAFGGLGSSIGTAGGALAGAKANDAASGLPEWLVLAVTEASVVGFDTDGRRRPTRPIFRLERARLETKVHQRVNVRVLELIDRETGARIELEGNRIPTLHTGPVLDALKDWRPASRCLTTLPIALRGSSSRKRISRGRLCGASSPATWSISSRAAGRGLALGDDPGDDPLAEVRRRARRSPPPRARPGARAARPRPRPRRPCSRRS